MHVETLNTIVFNTLNNLMSLMKLFESECLNEFEQTWILERTQ